MQASPTPLQAVHTTSASEPPPASAPTPSSAAAPASSLSPVGTPSALGQTRGSSIRTPLKPTFVFTPVASVSPSASSSAPFPSPRAPAPPPVPRPRSPATPALVLGPVRPVHVPSSPLHLSSSPTPVPNPAPTPVPAPVLPHAHAPRASEPTLAPSPAPPAPIRSPAPARPPAPTQPPLPPAPVSAPPRSAPAQTAPAPSPATAPAPTLVALPPSQPVALTPQSAPAPAPAPAPALELAPAPIQAQPTSPAPLPLSEPVSVAPQPTQASLPVPNPRRRGRQPKPRLGLGLGLGLIASESPAALSAPSSTASVSRSSSPSALPSASSSTTLSSPGLTPTPGASPAAVPTLRIRLRAPPLPQTPEVNMAKGKGKGKARARGGTGTPAGTPRTPGTPGTPTGLAHASVEATASGAPSSSRRVLPQRIRRAAGGGAEGVRELEEMIVDWLERFGDVDSTPPERLPLVLTTLPVTLVTPAARIVNVPAQTTMAPEAAPQAGPSRPRIETPAWKLVSAGEDDRDEAREELTAGARASPTKRLRRGPFSHSAEDTSDAYYEQQHRKFEAFERRQWVREREKLQHARYKMRARVDLLRNLPAGQWVAVVSAILSRKDDGAWARGRRKLDTEGLDWLRRRLIREGRDLLTRYDQLLPNPTETKQIKRRTLDTLDSRLSSPSIASSMSPPPQEVPQKRRAAAPPPSRLQAVKAKRAYSRRKVEEAPIVPMDIDSDSSLSSLESSPEPALLEPELPPVEPPAVRQPSPPRTRARRTTSPIKAATPRLRIPVVHAEVAAPAPVPETPPTLRATPHTTPNISTRSLRARSSVSPKKSAPPSPVVPVLLSAAEKREAALAETLAARAKAEASVTRNTYTRRTRIPREKTRGSERILAAAPFGIPLPPSVESKSEFTLSDEEEFWPLCAARVAHKNEQCRAQHTDAGGSHGVEASGTGIGDGARERAGGEEQRPVPESQDGEAGSAGVRDTALGPASYQAEDIEMKGPEAFARQQTEHGVKGSGLADTHLPTPLPAPLTAPLHGTLPALPLDDSTDEVDMEGVEAVVL